MGIMRGLKGLKRWWELNKEKVKGGCIVGIVKTSTGDCFHILTRSKSAIYITLCNRILSKDEVKKVEEWRNWEFLSECVNQPPLRQHNQDWFCVLCGQTLAHLVDIGFYKPSDIKIVKLKKKGRAK